MKYVYLWNVICVYIALHYLVHDSISIYVILDMLMYKIYMYSMQ